MNVGSVTMPGRKGFQIADIYQVVVAKHDVSSHQSKGSVRNAIIMDAGASIRGRPFWSVRQISWILGPTFVFGLHVLSP